MPAPSAIFSNSGRGGRFLNDTDCLAVLVASVVSGSSVVPAGDGVTGLWIDEPVLDNAAASSSKLKGSILTFGTESLPQSNVTTHYLFTQ